MISVNMPTICPTITVETPQEFSEQLARIQAFAPRLHIDLADGAFAPRKLLDPAQAYVPAEIATDIHVMFAQPMSQLMTLISLRPQLIIVHAEAEGAATVLQELQKVGIKAGIALLPATTVKSAASLVQQADHVLIFAGHLGYQGGEADMSQLSKVKEITALNPEAEVAWDGGVNDQNIAELAAGGVDVINVGGFIQHAADPAAAFARLQLAVA